MKFAWIAFLFMLVATVCADDITTSDGKVYKDATIFSHNALNATLLYSGGQASVRIDQLSPDLQKKLGYDPVQAEAFKHQLEEKYLALLKARSQEALRKVMKAHAVFLDGTITEKAEGGLIVMCLPPDSSVGAVDDGERAPSGVPARYGTFFLKNHPDEATLIDGDKIHLVVYPAGHYLRTYDTLQAYTATLP